MDLPALLHEVLAAYHQRHDLRNVPIKIDSLCPLIESMGVVDRIIWESINFSSRSVLANVKFSPKRADRNNRSDFAIIKYSASLNLCWRRFVILKEMFHCLLDTGTDLRVSNTDDLKTLSQGLVSGAVGAVAGFAPYHTEEYAAFLAMETLFPYETRESHAAGVAAGLVTVEQLAVRYRIPIWYADQAMLPAYMKSLEAWRSQLFVPL